MCPVCTCILAECIFYSELAAIVHSRKPRSLLAAKWISLHDFLTFTDEKYTCDVSVMHWGGGGCWSCDKSNARHYDPEAQLLLIKVCLIYSFNISEFVFIVTVFIKKMNK